MPEGNNLLWIAGGNQQQKSNADLIPKEFSLSQQEIYSISTHNGPLPD